MSYTDFYYQRWDGQIIQFTASIDLTQRITVTSTPRFVSSAYSNAPMFTFSNLSIHDRDTIAIQLGTKNFLIPKEFFYSKIESLKYVVHKKGKVCQPLMIDNISEYINAINYYRYVSVIRHLHTLKCKVNIGESDFFDFLDDELVQLASCEINHLAQEIENSFTRLNNKLSSVRRTASDASKIADIDRAISTYENGGSFCYYRGVGHIYYPESPGIFRKDHLHEEARWYRMMKSNFHDTLDTLHYLDRLAMMQHYDLPTRLLDVTGNPLVALYMAVNKIYTLDDPMQLDYAEVITYFDALTDTKTYDSGCVLILAALAKLSYDEKETLRCFINAVENGINNYPAIKDKLKRVINYCIHTSACHSDCEYYFAEHEKIMLNALIPYEWTKPSDICDFLELDKKIYSYNAFIETYFPLLTTVRRENPAFVDNIDVFMLTKAFHVRTGVTNDRMRVQDGSFIICGLEKDYINRQMTSSRSENIRRLFIRNKRDIYRALNSLAINDMTMFPDMVHQARYLKEQRY